MALFERENDKFRPDLRSQALSVIAVENDFVEGVYDKLAKVYDVLFGPILHQVDLNFAFRFKSNEVKGVMPQGIRGERAVGNINVHPVGIGLDEPEFCGSLASDRS